MRDIMNFSANTVAQFENNYDNMLEFNGLMMDAANRVYTKYSKEETDKIIRNQFNKICGFDFKTASPMKRHQALRSHGMEIAALVEDTLVDRMNSGWNAGNAKFMDLVHEINLSEGDQNEFYVEDNSLLQVSRFSGNHHDVNSLYGNSVRVA